MLVLAFDYGTRFVGVAAGQSITNTATGLTTLSGKSMWREIEVLIKEHQPNALIVGNPINMDGTRSAMSTAAEEFGQALEKRTGLPVHLHDERLTTREALDQLDAAKAFGQARTDHEMAACLIAQSWLEQSSAAR